MPNSVVAGSIQHGDSFHLNQNILYIDGHLAGLGFKIPQTDEFFVSVYGNLPGDIQGFPCDSGLTAVGCDRSTEEEKTFFV